MLQFVDVFGVHVCTPVYRHDMYVYCFNRVCRKCAPKHLCDNRSAFSVKTGFD